MNKSLTGTFFWVTTATLSVPRTPMVVTATDLTALNAYSEKQSHKEKKTSEYEPQWTTQRKAERNQRTLIFREP